MSISLETLALAKEYTDKHSGGGGTGGTTNYNNLTNKPSINGVTLEGNKKTEDFGIKDGETPNIEIGEVTTLEAGSDATASITGETPNLVLNLGIPKGDNGAGVPPTNTASEGDVLTNVGGIPVWKPPQKSEGNTDELIGKLPYKIEENGCYLLSNSAATISTDGGAENLYVRTGEYLNKNPISVVWGSDSVEFIGSNAGDVNVCTHINEANTLKPSTTYTLFADLENVGVRICYTNSDYDPNKFLGIILSQINDSGYAKFTTPETEYKWFNLNFVCKNAGEKSSASNIAIFEGEHTVRPEGGSFSILPNEKANVDGYIGYTLYSDGDSDVFVYKKSVNEKTSGSVIFFGDSILDFSGVPELYSKITGKSILDCSVAGTRMSGGREQNSEYFPYDMVNIANAISSGDFSSQINNGKNNNFSILQSGSISAYETIVMEFGTNDYTAKAPFNGEGVDSIEGALKHILTTIFSAYPTMRIVVLSTLQYVTAGSGNESGVPTHDDGTVWQMNEIIRGICESDEFCVPFIDIYHSFSENSITRDILTSDGVHLSSSYGAPRYANILTGELNKIGV